MAVRHVDQPGEARREVEVEEVGADQQPVLHAQVVGDAQDVDAARRRGEHAVEEADVEIGETVQQEGGHLRFREQVHQQPVESAQEARVLPDAGPGGHERESAPLLQTPGETGEIEPVRLGPAVRRQLFHRFAPPSAKSQ